MKPRCMKRFLKWYMLLMAVYLVTICSISPAASSSSSSSSSPASTSNSKESNSSSPSPSSSSPPAASEKQYNSSNQHHKYYHHSKATQARQSPMSAASAIVGALGSMVPSLITNVAPLVLLVGLGALMMPQLGQSAMGLFRESRRSAQDPHQQLPLGSAAPGAHFAGALHQYGQSGAPLPQPMQANPQDIYYFTKRSLGSSASNWMPNSEQMLHGLQEVLERVTRALDNADRRYN